MKHQNNIMTLYKEYGLEYVEKCLKAGSECSKFSKDGKVIWRNIYKSNGNEYVRYDGREFFFE